MPVNIRGKNYKTVAERVAEFRGDHGDDFSIVTEIISAGELVQMKAGIISQEGRVIATGYAEEVRGSTNINTTSALENCETSAIGRALASFGYGGTEYASADEVANAIAQQSEDAARKKAFEFYSGMAEAIRKNWDSVIAIKQHIALGEIEEAQEDWAEIPQAEQEAMWVAPSKGGLFTTEERKLIKEGAQEQAA